MLELAHMLLTLDIETPLRNNFKKARTHSTEAMMQRGPSGLDMATKSMTTEPNMGTSGGIGRSWTWSLNGGGKQR
uniref:ABC transporter domain-containing protein n=1 Tax=Panagrellus redivivus TaxID=6233 RepID=A0A7E4VD97_PANRE